MLVNKIEYRQMKPIILGHVRKKIILLGFIFIPW